MKTTSARLTTLLCGYLLLTSIACSKVGFDAAKDNGDGSVSANVTPTGTPPAVKPRVKFISPPCKANTQCEVEFRLDQTYTQPIDFDWRTNDTLYQTPHSPVYGEPNKHYIPTSGHVTFRAGETSQKVYVQNVNRDTYDIIIGVIISNCAFGNAADNCSDYFL
jgi:hypothetical protein